MGTQDDKVEALTAQSLKAARKVERQSEMVARLNGSASRHPEEEHLLIEMRANKAAIDVNRALFEYGQDGDAPNVTTKRAPRRKDA